MAEKDDNAACAASSAERRPADDPSYIDHSRVPVNAKSSPYRVIDDGGKKCRGLGSNFPAKLHKILSDPKHAEIITWMPHGRSWKVLKPREFAETVASKYFAFSKFSSFSRQVNGWGFKRLTQGRDDNCYYHELFLRGMPHLLKWIRRPSKLVRLRPNAENEPDFYEISKENPLPEIASSSPQHNNSPARSALSERTGEYYQSQKERTITTAPPPPPPHDGYTNCGNSFATNQRTPSSYMDGAESFASRHQEVAPRFERTSISPPRWWHSSDAEIPHQHEAGQVNRIVDSYEGHSWNMSSIEQNASPPQQQRQGLQLPVKEKHSSSYAKRRPHPYGPSSATLSPPEPRRQKDRYDRLPPSITVTEQRAHYQECKDSDRFSVDKASNCKDYAPSFHQQRRGRNTAFRPAPTHNDYPSSSVDSCAQYEPRFNHKGEGNVFAIEQQLDPLVVKSSPTAVSSERVYGSPNPQSRACAFGTSQIVVDKYDAGRDMPRRKEIGTSTCAVEEENPFLRIMEGVPPNRESVYQHSAEPARMGELMNDVNKSHQR